MVMGERRVLTDGEQSLLGDESRDEGLDDIERGDMGLAKGDVPCCSTAGKRKGLKCIHINEGYFIYI